MWCIVEQRALFITHSVDVWNLVISRYALNYTNISMLLREMKKSLSPPPPQRNPGGATGLYQLIKGNSRWYLLPKSCASLNGSKARDPTTYYAKFTYFTSPNNGPYSSFSNFVWKRDLSGKMAAFLQQNCKWISYRYRFEAHIGPVDYS